MSEFVRYGVIGTGMMGVEHIYNVVHLTGASVTAIADTNEGSRRIGQKAAELPDDAVFADYRDLLASGLCDAVVVASPNFTHAGILEDVLATDLHVLAEKPLCTTVEDAARVTEAARRRSALSWMALEYRYMAPIAALVEEVRAGRAGMVHQVAIREHRFPFLAKVDNWNRFSANTGGTLVEKCCHFFDLMNLITLATPVRVMASGAQSVNHLDERYDGRIPDIIDNAYVIIEYDSGARALLDLCMFAEGSSNEQEIAVTGDAGKVEAFVPESVVRVASREPGSMIERTVPSHAAYDGLHHGSSYLEHVDFVDAIRNGTPAKVTFQDGLIAVAMGVAAHRSIDERRPVALADVLV